ncbi:MAG: CtsR family transcriptional regulator [Clostridia bacterium]|nr:CtsR family transcriptional regulator [Clostridia bacterium]
MANISDIIEMFLKDLLDDASNQTVEIQRNELANYFKCAPSQINYVLTTRFSMDKGYIVESRRGGGGFIKIVQMDIDKDRYIEGLISEIGSSINKLKAVQIIQLLYQRDIITNREGEIMNAAVNDRSIHSPLNIKNEIRANVLKSMMLAIYKNR